MNTMTNLAILLISISVLTISCGSALANGDGTAAGLLLLSRQGILNLEAFVWPIIANLP